MKGKTVKDRPSPEPCFSAYQSPPQHVWYHQLVSPIHWLFCVCPSWAPLGSPSALCSERLIPWIVSSGSPTCWLPVGFGQWEVWQEAMRVSWKRKAWDWTICCPSPHSIRPQVDSSHVSLPEPCLLTLSWVDIPVQVPTYFLPLWT